MVSFHYIHEPIHHPQLTECLMKLKDSVFGELLYQIANGTVRVHCLRWFEIRFATGPTFVPPVATVKTTSNRTSNSHLAANQGSKSQPHLWRLLASEKSGLDFIYIGLSLNEVRTAQRRLVLWSVRRADTWSVCTNGSSISLRRHEASQKAMLGQRIGQLYVALSLHAAHHE